MYNDRKKVDKRGLDHDILFQERLDNQLALSKIFRERKLDKLFLQNQKKLKNLHQNSPLRNQQYYQQAYAIALEQYYHDLQFGRKTFPDYQKLLDAIDILFISTKLKHASAGISHQNLLSFNYQLGLTTTLAEYLNEHPELLNNPVIDMHFYCHQLITSTVEPQRFEDFNKKIQKYKYAFREEELELFCLYASSYFSRKINKGDRSYLADTHQLNKMMIDWGLTQRLNFMVFQIIITAALNRKDFEWAERFIHEYHQLLPEKVRSAAFHQGMARLAYRRHQLNEAIYHLKYVHYQDDILMMSVKTTMAQVLFDLKEWEVLDSHLSAMQNYLRRKMDVTVAVAYLNFCLTLQKLLRLPPKDKKAREVLLREINDPKNKLADKHWLIERLNKI